jgi:hypothetical protein
MTHPDTSCTPEADLAEQQTPATPEEDDAPRIPDFPTGVDANEADVLEQASVLTFLDEDDYRQAEPAGNRA